MSKKSRLQAECSTSREGKIYSYQQPQETGTNRGYSDEPYSVGSHTVGESKGRLLDAFEQLIDAMMAPLVAREVRAMAARPPF